MSKVEDPIKDTSGSYNNTTFIPNDPNNVFLGNFKDSNDHELPFNDEDDFNDMENEGLGLVMDVRSTTFRDLAEMIPRCYGDINDITQKEEEIVTNDRSNLDITGSSSPSHDPLEEMKIRNQEKWAQLGYDPKAGRGNMKMSITLSNFKPSAILENSNFSQNKPINSKSIINSHVDSKCSDQSQQLASTQLPENNENNSYSTQVLQSYSMCLNPTKQVHRVNSSNDPSTFIAAESNTDDNDDNQVLNSAVEEQLSTTNLNTAALLASFQPLEEDLQAPEQELRSFNDTHNNNGSCAEDTDIDNSSSEYASNSMTEQQTSNSNSDEEEKIVDNNVDTHKESRVLDDKIVVPKTPKSLNSSLTSGDSKSYSDNKSNDNSKNDYTKSSKSRKTITYQSQRHYDNSPYDDPNFDYETASKDVPPNLLKIIKYPKTGIVFRAICGQSMSQYPKGVAQYVTAELKTVLDKCILKNMVTESAYVSSIIDSIKTEIGTNNYNKKYKFDENRSMNAEESLSKKHQYWANQKAILNSEKEVRLQEIELRYQDELENLEMLWNSEKKRAQFNKPSAQLIVLRQSVQTNLAAKRFQEAAQLASKAERLDKTETELAAQRMRQAYSAAAERLKQKFENERQALFQSFEAKRISLAAQEEADLRPIENRIQKYNNNNNQQLQSNQFDNNNSTLEASSGFATSTVPTRRSISVMSKVPGNYGPIIKKPVIKAPNISSQANAKLKLSSLKPNT